MKKSILGIILLSTSLLATSSLLAQNGAGAGEKQQKLARVSTLKTVEANREFQANVQVMQAQRQQVVSLNAAIGKETNTEKKKDLKAKLDEQMVKLNENNRKMVKAYGFSLDRNYILVIETAHVYMLVSDEEAAEIMKKEQAAAGK